MTLNQTELGRRLEELAREYRVPGASLAVHAGGRTVLAAAGVLNQDTGVETTTDSLFQIGSITKTLTTTLVMQLVDEGLLDLDEPVVKVLPEFKVADPDVTASVTMRHLLTHTSGIQGDVFTDVGRGDDVLERFMARCADLDQSHPIGATQSYCNTGFGVAGRVIEVLTGKLWDTALRERLLAPLGMDRAFTLPEDVLRFRAAMGHLPAPEGGADDWPRPAPRWDLPRSAGPAGTVVATAEDLVTFARMHLADGAAADGTRVLSATSARMMREPQVAVPDRWTLADHWGLGWFLPTWEGRTLYGHDGGTIGQSAFLRILPDRDVVIVLLTNGGRTRELFRAVANEVLPETAGLRVPGPPQPPAEPIPVDLADWYGSYERHGVRMDLAPGEDGTPELTVTIIEGLAGLEEPPHRMPLTAVDPDVGLFVTREQDFGAWTPVVLHTLGDGSRYIHFHARATPKTS
ncbi:serine hydrolase domain-containing protein [Streptomyces sp. NPDC048411]|uniref:serine hydrolase domain-containing protein n=1 Tax=Streptomyces sp. NPDC048411 TaxID=3157206 RepID=UPI0034527BD0